MVYLLQMVIFHGYNVPGYKPLYFLRISQPAKFDKTEGKVHHTQPGYD